MVKAVHMELDLVDATAVGGSVDSSLELYDVKHHIICKI